MATLLPQGEAWISETGTHFAMYDDQHNDEASDATWPTGLISPNETPQHQSWRRSLHPEVSPQHTSW
jgi:hypothetical protein